VFVVEVVIEQARLADAVSVGLLARAFPADVVDAAVERAGVKEQVNRALPARLMVYFMLACWLWSRVGYVRVLRELVAGLRWSRGGYDGWKLPYDGSIAKARVRLGEAVMADLFDGCAGPVGRDGDAGVFWRGLRVMAIDGTVYDLERTEENLAVFGVPSGGVFPQARMVALAECGTLAVAGAAFDSIAVGERELAGRLLDRLTAGMLVLADRGFPSWELFGAAAGTGAQLAWRVSGAFALPLLQRLPDGTYRSELRGPRGAAPVPVRVVEFAVKDADTGISELFALVTTLMDTEAYPAAEIARLYLERWKAELVFEILKVQVRETHATLRSKSPAMVRQELYALLCCYQAIRQVIACAAHTARIDPRDIRFPEALDAVRRSVATVLSPR
jgi:hypothetical protein